MRGGGVGGRGLSLRFMYNCCTRVQSFVQYGFQGGRSNWANGWTDPLLSPDGISRRSRGDAKRQTPRVTAWSLHVTGGSKRPGTVFKTTYQSLHMLIAQSETCMFFDSLISLKIVLVILCILNIKQSFVFTTVWAFLAVKTTFWVTHWFKKGCIDDELFLFLAT